MVQYFLIELLFATALVHEVASARGGRPAEGRTRPRDGAVRSTCGGWGKGGAKPVENRRCVFLVNVVRFSWSLTCRCPRDPQSYASLVNYNGKVTLGSPGPMFYGTFCGPKNSPQGSVRLGRATWGGQARRFGLQKTVVSLKRNAYFSQKTVR